MGLITGLLGLPLAPIRGTIAAAEQVLHAAEDEYYDPDRIREQLEEIDRLRGSGELTEDEAVAYEDELVERLIEGQKRRGER
jgi:chorismate mutase